MQPLNPYLCAFFRSALPAQCQPISHHALLVPTTDVLLRSKDRDTDTAYAELAGTEEFLASHVVRVHSGGPPGGAGWGRDGGAGHARDSKGRAKQYSTLNGRTVVVKDSFVYSNKGFKTLNQAQLLSDTIYFPDAADGQQWLVYFISRPLVGSYLATPIVPAVLSDAPSRERKRVLAEAAGEVMAGGPSAVARKKHIGSFGELLASFPMIGRQMQTGLETVIREFVSAHDKPLPKARSRSSSVGSATPAPSLSDSVGSIRSGISAADTVHPTNLELEPEEQTLRTSLETAIVSAIDLFQNVDKAQLSLLGTNTELTGPVVERMIERYVTEQVHDQTLFPRICAIRRPDDSDLEWKIRKMSDIDIAQVGVPIENGMRGKRALSARLNKGIGIFRKMGVARSPEEMLEILLNTQKATTGAGSGQGVEGVANDDSPPAAMTISADILVSMLLIVVIRSGVRHLHSRLLYMRYFIFIDEVDSGEQGYALATLEAVLAHLSGSSSALRKASKRNRLLWQAAKLGDKQALRAILDPVQYASEGLAVAESPIALDSDTSEDESFDDITLGGTVSSGATPMKSASIDFGAVNGALTHVFPFQRPPTPPPGQLERRVKKHVSMASLPRSHSASSAYSSRSHSRHKSIDSDTSAGLGIGGDLSTDKLAQTQDGDGNSVLMMAVDAGKHDALKFLLSMPAHFRAAFVLEDVNNEGATLLSAAVQSGNRDITNELIDFLESNVSDEELQRYIRAQDGKGRCVAHYLFHQPHLIQKFGKKLPWRMKDKNGQTPLFALCRSYDHEQYHSMINSALKLATDAQGDGEPLHLDDHVDAKGNTLLHVMNDMKIALRLLRHCDSDVNAANDKHFTPLMVASKYGRIDLVRTLFGDPRVDMTLKDLRGLTAVELAKDDEVRNRIDDLVLLSSPPGKDGRITTVVRSFFVEDATVRLVLKSGAPNKNGLITVTTCRRSVADFENLSKWLSIECPASWLPTHLNLPSPFLIPSKPSRTILRDIQLRLDSFFRSLLSHGTFAQHELVWEFFLMPDIDSDMLAERSKRKAEARVENVRDEFEPVYDTAEVENFVEHAREQVRGVAHAVRQVIRETNKHRMLSNDLSSAQSLSSAAMCTINFLPPAHLRAFDRYTTSLVPSESDPLAALYYALHSMHSTSTAVQVATNRPASLIQSMHHAQRSIDRSAASLHRSHRWTPNLGIFEEAKKTAAREAWAKAARARNELERLGCELRYTQQTIAQELAAWQEEHVRNGRRVLRKLAKDSIVKERASLDGMKRALRALRVAKDDDVEEEEGEGGR